MTMDRSLRIARGSSGSRSVLSRVERIAKLKESDRWKEGQSPLGLPKVRVYKLAMKKKKVKSKEEADAAKATSGSKPAAAAKPAGKK